MEENRNILPAQDAGGRVFTQEDVNRIVCERLAAEKRKLDAAFAEREQLLAQRELRLTAKEKLADMGIPVELADALNVSSPEAMEKAITILERVTGKTEKESTGWTPDFERRVRDAMGLS